MSSQSTDVIDEVSKWTVGLGILTLALAPLAIPILALTAVALVPLVLPLVALALAAGFVAAPIMLIRSLVRRIAARRQTTTEGRVPAAPISGRLGVSPRS